MSDVDWNMLFSDAELHKRLKYYLLSSVKNGDTAEELCQEVLAKGWEKRNSLKDVSKLDAWLFSIARNVLMDYYRHVGIIVDDEAEELLHVSHSEDMAQRADLEDALEKLPEIQKQVIVMRFYNNCSIQEVADALGKTPQSIKMIQYRAIKSMREFMKPFDNTERLNNDGEY